MSSTVAGPSNGRTVFNYDTHEAYCPVCHEALAVGWHYHTSKTWGLVTSRWMIESILHRRSVRAWKIGKWLWYHRWDEEPLGDYSDFKI